MPIPKPRMGAKPESRSEFISRCAGDATMNRDYPETAQRVAVCYAAYRDAHPGAAKPPKAISPADCTPQASETMTEFMSRCVDGGEDEPACRMAWDAAKALQPVERDVQMKWMPSLLEVKGLNEGQRMIRGIATTPSVDHVGDIVESLGAKYNLPIPLLLYHDHKQPVGHVTFVQPSDKGIPFEAHIAKVDEPGKLKDRVDEAWHSIKAGLVKGVSIGFTPVPGEYETIKGGGLKFRSWRWHELSLVVVPANQDATITVIRSLDAQALRAATGSKQKERVLEPAGVSASSNAKKPESKMARTIAEDISSYEATLLAHQTKMDEMMDKASDEGLTLDAEQEIEYDELKEKVAAVKKHLDRLREREKSNRDAAVVVDGDAIGRNAGAILPQRAAVQVKRPPLEKGTAFTRYVIALAMAKGNPHQAAEIARRDAWKDTPEVANVLQFAASEGSTQFTKAAVSPATTYSSGWADSLVQYQYMTSEFVDMLRSATVVDRLTGFRRVPFNIRVPVMSSGSTAYWVGEGSAKPLSSAAFTTFTMSFAKCAALVAFTQESLRFSNPSLEALVRQDMIAAIAKKLDYDFLDPTKTAGTGSGGPSPASVFNGATAINATGTTADAAFDDMRTLLNTIAALDIPMTGGTWIMHPTQAISFSLMLNALSQPYFPTITPEGGTLLGFRVLTTTNIPSSGGSPTDGYMMGFCLPGEILLSDDGNVSIDASDQASLQFDSAPDSPATASTVMVSLWQSNLVALRAEREINWYRRRTGACQYIDYAKYVP